MKYIRTKDGIYSVYTDDLNLNDEIDTEIAGFRAMYCRDLSKSISKEDIIKVADTIEELCDEFVWITPENEKHIKPKSGDGLWLLCCNYKDGHKIYGAIWTDKGLIYVAKMNDKGELCLIQ